ncbi:MAG: cytochrome c-type biogenesis protein CcmH [Deltaproteobacteria bacterium]|nr:cytochrome c-type biogenesis protein CcmH [Deltaproteobacteria bacterium]
MAKKRQSKFCPGCGELIEPGDKFCPQCGRRIPGEKRRHIAQQRKGTNWKWVAIVSMGVAILVVVIFSGVNKNKEKKIYAAHNTAQIASIVSQFDCSCGQCDKILATCDCPTAQDTYAYISDLVNGGKYSRKEVIQMVNRRYGHYIGKEPLTG